MRSALFVLGVYAVAVAISANPAVAGSPSFECAKASNPLEEMLCSNDDLGEIDLRMANAYARRRAAAPVAEKDQLFKDHQAFLSSRASRCGVPSSGAISPQLVLSAGSCLIAMYNQRLSALGQPQIVSALSQPASAAGDASASKVNPPSSDETAETTEYQTTDHSRERSNLTLLKDHPSSAAKTNRGSKPSGIDQPQSTKANQPEQKSHSAQPNSERAELTRAKLEEMSSCMGYVVFARESISKAGRQSEFSRLDRAIRTYHTLRQEHVSAYDEGVRKNINDDLLALTNKALAAAQKPPYVNAANTSSQELFKAADQCVALVLKVSDTSSSTSLPLKPKGDAAESGTLLTPDHPHEAVVTEMASCIGAVLVAQNAADAAGEQRDYARFSGMINAYNAIKSDYLLSYDDNDRITVDGGLNLTEGNGIKFANRLPNPARHIPGRYISPAVLTLVEQCENALLRVAQRR